jgi:hypothetical protein
MRRTMEEMVPVRHCSFSWLWGSAWSSPTFGEQPSQLGHSVLLSLTDWDLVRQDHCRR